MLDTPPFTKTQQRLAQVAEEIKKDREQMAIYELAEKYHGPDEVISSREMEELIAQQAEPDWNLYTGIPTIDQLSTGFSAGNLIIISAPTGNGKTKLCETITTNALEQQKYNSLWFTFEMPPRELIKRFGMKVPMFYLPKENKKKNVEWVDWVEYRIVEAIAKFNTKAVFIDHLHYLLPMDKIKNSSLELGGVVRKIKLLALQYNVVIFLVAHTKKTRYDEKMTLESIRDSSFIAQEADFVLMMSRGMKEDLVTHELIYTNETKISIQKNRKTGACGSAMMTIRDSRFVELKKKVEEEYG